MHYLDLHITHRAFWQIERRAKFYDQYMKQRKDWSKWPDSVSLDEIGKLLEFIPKWDVHFRIRDPERFAATYSTILPIIRGLQQERLETADFRNAELTKKIEEAFDEVAECSGEAYESTDSSKILHTILPHLIVMWDRQIRRGILGDEDKKEGRGYVSEFLPRMQVETLDAIGSCIRERRLSQEGAATYIRQLCGHESLPKLVDEHNFVIYTKTHEFREHLEKLRTKSEIRSEDYERLVRKIPLYPS